MLFLLLSTCYFIGLTNGNYGSPSSILTEDVETEPHRPFVASCYGTSGDITDIYWTNPKGLLIINDQEGNVYSSQQKGELRLSIVQPGQADEGVYLCQERGDEGETRILKSLSLRVLSKSEPTFEEPYAIAEAFEGENVSFTCEALGDKPIEYTWFNQHDAIITDSSNARVVVTEKGTELQFLSVSSETSGVYTCRASNQLGSNSKLFELIVKQRNDRPPVFKETRVEVHGVEDEPLTLDCQAEGNPQPTYVWYNLYGERLDRYHQRVIDIDSWNHSVEIPQRRPSTILVSPSNGTLIFVQLKSEDDGHYTCYARNSVGQDMKTYRIYVNESEVSRGFLSVHVENTTHNSVTFLIIAKGISEISGYEARYRLVNENDLMTVRWSVGAENKVTGLLSGGKYYFQFRIVSSDNWTEILTVALPPGPPEIIVRQVASNKLNMEFFRPFYLFSYDTIQRYIIKYRYIQQVRGNTWDYSSCEVTIELPSCRASKYEISGLSSGVYYSITVQAVGPGGYSDPSEIKVYIE